jgi:hypothetical protein
VSQNMYTKLVFYLLSELDKSMCLEGVWPSAASPTNQVAQRDESTPLPLANGTLHMILMERKWWHLLEVTL